ncbi:MAG TPA: hypothetical protein VHH36_07425 [Candidatus Thermoplasmatota archaeon]|nr:hypothetical protein [Candidatus Thermoplasmatota archaeon]
MAHVQNRDNQNLGNQGNLGREEIGHKGGVGSTGSTMHREGVGQNVKEGWQNFRAKVRGKWNQLTDKDLDQYQGRRRDDLVSFIGDRVGGDRTTIGRDVDNFARETNYRWD